MINEISEKNTSLTIISLSMQMGFEEEETSGELL